MAPEQPEHNPGPFEGLRERGAPFVLVDRFFPGRNFDSVCVDDRAAGRMATQFLIHLGHRRIAHIAGPALSTGSLRRRGFLDAMRVGGLSAPAELIEPGGFDIDGGREAMHRLVRAVPRPTAVFAASDPMAIGAVYACREAGLRVPEDVSIVGAGNIEGAHHPNPFLTTIDWPRVELGRSAATLLLDAIAQPGREKSEARIFSPTLLERQSTRPLAKASNVVI